MNRHPRQTIPSQPMMLLNSKYERLNLWLDHAGFQEGVVLCTALVQKKNSDTHDICACCSPDAAAPFPAQALATPRFKCCGADGPSIVHDHHTGKHQHRWGAIADHWELRGGKSSRHLLNPRGRPNRSVCNSIQA